MLLSLMFTALQDDEEAGGLSAGEVVGIVVGCLAGAVILGVVIAVIAVIRRMNVEKSYVI